MTAVAASAGGGSALSLAPTTPFLGKRLPTLKPALAKLANSSSVPKGLISAVAGGGHLIEAARDLFLGVGVGLPCTVMECGDIIYRSTLPKSNGLTLTAPGAVLAVAALSYLWAIPGVAPGFFDMFVLAFVERLFRPTFSKDDFVLGKKLGEGAFGVVYRVSLSQKPSSKAAG